MFINIIIFFSSIGMILSTGSVYITPYNRDLIPILTILLMSLLVFWRHIIDGGNRLKISLSGLIGIMFIVMVPFVIDFINYVESFQVTFFHIVVVMLTFLIGRDNQKKILKSYFTIMLIISSISIFYFFVNLIWGIENYLNPIYKNNMWNALVFPLWAKWDLPNYFFVRNMAIFFEPGAFAFHLIPSIMLAIKYKKQFPLLVFIIAGVTTFSTSMYLALLLFILFAISYRFLKPIKPRYFFAIIILFIIIFNTVEINDQDWSFINLAKTVLLDKFAAGNVSFEGRASFSMAALDMFINSNLIGYGHYSSEYMLDFDQMEGHATTTSAFFGLMADLGLFGIFCIFLYTRFFALFKLFSIPITFVWLNSEFMPYNFFTLFLLAHSATHFFPRFLTNRNNLIIDGRS